MDLPEIDIRAPTRGNRRLERLFDAANADKRLRAWWYMQQVNADRRDMSDHSAVHVQIVVNIALRLFRLLKRSGVEPAMVTEHGLKARDAEVVIAAACLFHDTGMSIHRTDHEQYSLFFAADRMPLLLEDIYDEPELTVVMSEALHAVIGHRRRGDPVTIEAGIVRVADALDMASGRSRIPFETRRPNIHSISAAAIDAVRIEPGEERAVRVEIEMNNSSGLFQVDELLATKLRGSGIEEHIEVVAEIDAEHEKRLVPVFRIYERPSSVTVYPKVGKASSMGQQPLVELDDVRKSFGDNVVLNDVDLVVERGSAIVIAGPSGSGKSTMLRCINGLEPVDEGEVRFDGAALDYSGKAISRLRAEIGMVFQQFNLFPHMTVLDNVVLGPVKAKHLPRRAGHRPRSRAARAGGHP